MENTLKVFVLNMRGQPLMPCSPPKARKLLRAGKAVPVRRTPFVIQLTVPTGETKQPITLGVDAGYKHVGLSATTAKEELLASEVELRQDVTGLLSNRLALRRARRNRKTRYRVLIIAFDQSTRVGLRRPWRTAFRRTYRTLKRFAECFRSPKS